MACGFHPAWTGRLSKLDIIDVIKSKTIYAEDIWLPEDLIEKRKIGF